MQHICDLQYVICQLQKCTAQFQIIIRLKISGPIAVLNLLICNLQIANSAVEFANLCTL